MVGRGVVAQRLGQPVEVAHLEFGRGLRIDDLLLDQPGEDRAVEVVAHDQPVLELGHEDEQLELEAGRAIRAKRMIGCGTRSTRG